MKMKSLDLLTDYELLEQFNKAAQGLGNNVVCWLPTAKKADRLFAIKNELRKRGAASRMVLEKSLKNDNRFVRYYAAKELYGLLPQQCRPVIEANTREFDAIVGDARGFLRAIDEGTYKPQ